MKAVITLAILLFSVQAFTQLTVNVAMLNRTAPANSDTVYYSPSKKLIWPQFKGKAQAGSDAAAVTTSGFGYNASIVYDDESGELDITVSCYFNKKSSWVKTNRKTNYILNHEQKHFDITYIWACNFLSQLRSYNFSKENFNQEIKKIYKECYTSMQQMQDEYDTETMNGQLSDQQNLWNTKISQLMATL